MTPANSSVRFQSRWPIEIANCCRTGIGNPTAIDLMRNRFDCFLSGNRIANGWAQNKTHCQKDCRIRFPIHLLNHSMLNRILMKPISIRWCWKVRCRWLNSRMRNQTRWIQIPMNLPTEIRKRIPRRLMKNYSNRTDLKSSARCAIGWIRFRSVIGLIPNRCCCLMTRSIRWTMIG